MAARHLITIIFLKGKTLGLGEKNVYVELIGKIKVDLSFF